MRKARLCPDCGAEMEWRTVEQEYERDGNRVRLTGLPAMVCPRCGGVSFDPETTDRTIEAANALFKVAKGGHKAALAAGVAP